MSTPVMCHLHASSDTDKGRQLRTRQQKVANTIRRLHLGSLCCTDSGCNQLCKGQSFSGWMVLAVQRHKLRGAHVHSRQQCMQGSSTPVCCGPQQRVDAVCAASDVQPSGLHLAYTLQAFELVHEGTWT